MALNPGNGGMGKQRLYRAQKESEEEEIEGSEEGQNMNQSSSDPLVCEDLRGNAQESCL